MEDWEPLFCLRMEVSLELTKGIYAGLWLVYNEGRHKCQNWAKNM